jgi:hypothetical protein
VGWYGKWHNFIFCKKLASYQSAMAVMVAQEEKQHFLYFILYGLQNVSAKP